MDICVGFHNKTCYYSRHVSAHEFRFRKPDYVGPLTVCSPHFKPNRAAITITFKSLRVPMNVTN